MGFDGEIPSPVIGQVDVLFTPEQAAIMQFAVHIGPDSLADGHPDVLFAKEFLQEMRSHPHWLHTVVVMGRGVMGR